MSVLQPNASAWAENYGYDQFNRLSNIVSAAGNFIYDYYSTMSDRVEYLGLGGLNSYSEHSYIENEYDSQARLTSTTLMKDYSTTLNQHSYVMNDANQRTKQTFTGGNYADYTYDSIGQLKTARGTESDTTTVRLNEQFGYEYDKAWNLNYRTNNALTQTFNTDNLNQLTTGTRSGTLTVAGLASQPGANLTSVTVSGTGLTTGSADIYDDGSWAKANATLANGNNTYTATAVDTLSRTATDSLTVNLPSTVTFQYDGNGNLTNDGRRVFEYDYENQLTNVYVASTWRSEFKYDAFGRRKVRREYTWQSSAWLLTNEVRYVYDGMLVAQERDANNVTLVSYTRGNDLSGSLQGAGGIGGLLARTENGRLAVGDASAHAYYHVDGNGNITAMVNTNGVIVARYNYDPYGNLLGAAGPLAEVNLYRFSSKEYHGNAGLYYYGFRCYEPNLQRWLNRDPIQERGGVNLFAFAFDNPTDNIDSLGLSCWKKIVKVWEAVKQERKIVADISGKNAKETIDETKKALDSIKGKNRGVTTPNIKSRDKVAEKLSDNGKALPEERSPGYPKHTHPEKGKYRDVHVEAGFMGCIVSAVSPQACRLSKDPEASYLDVTVAGLWDAVSTVDPIFLTDAIEWAAGVRPDDFEVECQNEK